MERKAVRAYITEKDIFAKRLRETMEKRGLNQTSLSAKIFEDTGVKIQRQTISLYMNGQSKPDVDRLILLSRSLGVSADYLLGFIDVWQPEMEFRAVCDYTGLSGNTIENLHHWAERASHGTKIEGEIYEFFDPCARINDLFNCTEGYLFLAALDQVRSGVLNCERHLDSAVLSPINLRDSIRDLKLSVYELEGSVRKLADCLYGVEAVEKRLDKAYLDICLNGIEEYCNPIEEDNRGEHQED